MICLANCGQRYRPAVERCGVCLRFYWLFYYFRTVTVESFINFPSLRKRPIAPSAFDALKLLSGGGEIYYRPGKSFMSGQNLTIIWKFLWYEQWRTLWFEMTLPRYWNWCIQSAHRFSLLKERFQNNYEECDWRKDRNCLDEAHHLRLYCTQATNNCHLVSIDDQRYYTFVSGNCLEN